MKPWAFFTLTFFTFSGAFLQNNNEIDSLKTLLAKVSADSSRARIQLHLSDKLAKNESENAKDFALEALKYYQKTEDKKKQAEALANTAFAYMNSGEFEKAIDYNMQALAIYEKLGDKKSQGNIHNKLGAVYYYLNNYPKALEYWQEALNHSVELNDKEGQGYLLNNIGLIYEKQGKYDSALVNHQQSLKIKEALNDRPGISGSINNIGNIFFYKKEYSKAIEHWKLALKIKEEIGEKPGIINSLQNIGYGYYYMKQYDKALDYIHRGLKMAGEINNRFYLKEGYIKLADVYSDLKNFEQAYEYQQLFWRMKDTLFNEQSAKQMAEMETKYQTEKKQKEIEIQNLQLSEQKAEITSQRLTIFASLGGALLLLALVFVVLRSNKQKQKANLLLKKQKQEIEIQKNIIEEKKRDITDSIEYARHIQDAILPEREKILQALPESFIFYLPKDIVSGDFYWFSQTKSGELLIAAADCTGHGVPGAFMSMIGSNTLTKIVAEQLITRPAEILNHLNSEIKSSLKQKAESSLLLNSLQSETMVRDGMDIAILCLKPKAQGTGLKEDRPESLNPEPGTWDLQFAGANRPLIFFDDGGLTEIAPDKTSVGGFTPDNFMFRNHSIPLKKDSMLYIFSDGYADQFGGTKGKKFMMKNLKELFRNIRNLPVAEQEKTLCEVFFSWKGELEQLDDVLIIGIRA